MLSGSSIEARLAWLRSVSDLCRRERLPQVSAHVDAVYCSILEDSNLIATRQALPGLPWCSPLDQVRSWALLGPAPDPSPLQSSPEVVRLAKLFRHTAITARQAEWAWRIGEENHNLNLAGWYPIFVTLTVDPSAADPYEVMHDGTEWKAFRQRMSEAVRQAGGLRRVNRGGPAVREYFRYAAVLEHGKSRHHHHIHALVWCKFLPVSWQRDSNQGRVRPGEARIYPVESLWPWSAHQVKACPFRFAGDAWQALGFVWPMCEGKSFDRAPARSAGVYLTKYLGKDHKAWNHRIKATNSLGLDSLRQWLKSKSMASLARLAIRNWSESSRNAKLKSSIPSGLMKRSSRSELISRLWATKSGRKRLMSVVQTRERYSAWQTMCLSVEDGISPWLMDSEARSLWLDQTLSPPVRLASFRKQAAEWLSAADSWTALQRGSRGVALAGI